MAQDMDNYLAQIMARTEQNLGEEANKQEEKIIAPEVKEIVAQTKAPEETKEEKTPVEIKPEEVEEAPVVVPAPAVKKKVVQPVSNDKIAKEVDDLFVASFTETEPKHMTRSEKKRKSGNRRAYVDKESGKKAGLFKGFFNLLGFLILVALTILAVLYLLQLIAGITIIDPVKIFDSVIQWVSELFT